jgi:MraZ protein
VFRGINCINLDEKWRLSLPIRYRETVKLHAANQLVSTIDTEERCLLLYPLPDWEDIQQKIESLSSFNKTTRRIQRLLIGHATDLTLDSNGRILLPQALREYANITRKIVLVGQGKKFEIWDEDNWLKQRDSWLGQDSLEVIPEDLRAISL